MVCLLVCSLCVVAKCRITVNVLSRIFTSIQRFRLMRTRRHKHIEKTKEEIHLKDEREKENVYFFTKTLAKHNIAISFAFCRVIRCRLIIRDQADIRNGVDGSISACIHILRTQRYRTDLSPHVLVVFTSNSFSYG